MTVGVTDARLLFLLLPLAGLGLSFAVRWVAVLRAPGPMTPTRPSAFETLVGFVTDFLDTLGVGSFAVTTSLYRSRATVPDRLLPGTLNVGHALPTIAQAFIYVAIIDVDLSTLVLLIAASVVGAWCGADVVSRWPERTIRLVMSAALLCAAGLMLARLLDGVPRGGDATGLHGVLLALGVLGNGVLGALMTMGIGLYGPCMILVSLLGMSPKVAFPIMMGSCAFLMPIAGMRFVRSGSYAPRPAVGLTLGGLPGVLIAAYIVKELPLDAVRWLVVAVASWTAVSMARAARARPRCA